MAGWLTPWKIRRKIIISNVNIDSELIDFPARIHISASSGTESADLTDVFTELGSDANRKKIAITTSDGTTQCYVEIERFDFSNNLATLWVKIPTISSASVTELYLYYDSSIADNTDYINDTGEIVAENVWDINFKMVQHMADLTTSAIEDSTSNDNNGTKSSASNPIEIDGKISKGQNFSSDQISVPSIGISVDWTQEAIFKTNSVSTDPTVRQYIYTQQKDPPPTGYTYLHAHTIIIAGNKISVSYYTGSGTAQKVESADASIEAGTYYYIAFKGDADGGKLYIDGVLVDSSAVAPVALTVNEGLIGRRGDTEGDDYFNGIIDEVRDSDGYNRSEAWIKATYYSNWDELVSYDSAIGGNNYIVANLPMIEAELIEGTLLDAFLPAITADITGGSSSGDLVATLPAITASIRGSSGGDLIAVLPAITADIIGGSSSGGLMAALPAITADLKGGAILEATLPAITASLEGDVQISGDLIVSLPAITASLEGKVNVHGDLVCILPAITAELTGTVEVGGNLACILPMITAELTGFQDISGDLVATLPMITALIEGTTGLADDDGDPIDADECGVILRYSKVGY